MMLIMSIFWIAIEKPEPMNIIIGEPVLDMRIQKLSGEVIFLEEVLDSSFAFFLSADCPKCLDAAMIINDKFAGRTHVAIIMVNPVEKVKEFQKNYPGLKEKADWYLVKSEEMIPYKIQTLPALLGYRKSRLKIAFHGPINETTGEEIIRLYNTRFSKGN